MSVLPESIPREKIRDLTKYMHTLMAEIIFFEPVVEWVSDCNNWLEIFAGELYQLKVDKDNEILEMIQFMRSDAKSFNGLPRALKERVQSQINVVCSSSIFTLRCDAETCSCTLTLLKLTTRSTPR